MAKTPDQEQLTDEVNKLQKLLADPHPGLFTWRMDYGERMKFISDFWTDGDKLSKAAPSLLEACKDAKHFLEDKGFKGELLVHLTDAIAKATT